MAPDPLPPAPAEELPADPALREFAELLRQARDGDQGACERLFKLFEKPILLVVRRHLNRQLRKVVDSTDLTQDVWNSLFVHVLKSQGFDSPRHFLAFLAQVAKTKTLERHRREIDTQKRSLSREEPLGQDAGERADRSSAGEDPSDLAEAREEWARLLAGLSDRDRAIVEGGFRDGHRLAELAQRLHVSVKTLRRVAERRQRVGK